MSASNTNKFLDSISHHLSHLNKLQSKHSFLHLFENKLAVRTSSLESPAKTISSIVNQCSESRTHLPTLTALSIHAYYLKSHTNFSPFPYNTMMSSVLHWDDLDNARKLFDEMPNRNIISYTMMVDAHMKWGLVDDALEYFGRNPLHSVVSYTAAMNGLVGNELMMEALLLFREMVGCGVMPNERTFTTVIKACVVGGFVGMQFVGLIVKMNFEKNVSVCNALIAMLSKMGAVDLAKRVFDEMGERDVVTWTAILDAYFEVGDLKRACKVFDLMPERNVISYSMMIARLSQNDGAEEAVNFFCRMVYDGYVPNVSCFASVLNASANNGNLMFGTNVHSLAAKLGFEATSFVVTSLIDMYAKCGKSEAGRAVFDLALDKNTVVWNSILGGYSFACRVKDAEEIFKQMPTRNIVSWNSMIASYDRGERYANALETFDEMLELGYFPTPMTFSSVLHSCANLPSLFKGKNLHGKIIKLGVESEVFVGTALVDMYSKCGDIKSSTKLFYELPVKNEVSWTAMIQGLADCGFAEDALNLFEEMKKANIKPTETMFLSLLFACSHRGLVTKGFHYFESMEKEYDIVPSERHYTCMVDLLSRAGLLREAEQFIDKMPITPEANSWAALLSGCCTYRNEEIGERVAEKMEELGKETSSAGYVLLSNIYASSGRWRKAAKMRKLMREAGVKKGGGCSWIEIRGRFHPFYSWNTDHIESLEIYGVLELLMSEMVKNSSLTAVYSSQ